MSSQQDIDSVDQSAEVDFLYAKAHARTEQRFKIVAIMGEYYVVRDTDPEDDPDYEGHKLRCIGGPFEFEKAALGYRSRTIVDWMDGRFIHRQCFGDAVEAWDKPVRILEFLKGLKDIEDPEKLAKELVAHEPWRKGKKH